MYIVDHVTVLLQMECVCYFGWARKRKKKKGVKIARMNMHTALRQSVWWLAAVNLHAVLINITEAAQDESDCTDLDRAQ